ncbi:cytidine deaminase [Pyxidicoccus parkwayensis]|uniref:Cytidine deaminase n=1 Tax=Pyxidicoccus parkwayensis TaxID=2813578 RepID=A0ABX7P0A2_9BACT|nr:anti-phage dCTP deaminase [Pyxidicoccus parkwaysis]QSQ23152.1 cytidine deaminase [Pyxidicoccus parkwaysis]
MAAAQPIPLIVNKRLGTGARDIVKQHQAYELFFAVVGHVGSGTTTIAEKLKTLLENPTAIGGPYQVCILKARDVIEEWVKEVGHPPSTADRGTFQYAKYLQDCGDAMREGEHAAVARRLVRRIRRARATMQGIEQPAANQPVEPDGKPRAYIIDALRHPAEVHLLRSLYQNAFALIGVVCQDDVRRGRLVEKFPRNAGQADVEDFMSRDAKDPDKKHGQRVTDAFHLADFFIDNSERRYLELERGETDPQENPDWNVPDDLQRLVRIVTHAKVERPTTAEYAMYAAHGAKMRSACLSRQVGAALVDERGNIAATGANEVPRAGGGVYGQGFEVVEPSAEHRCAFRKNVYCSNTKEQDAIIDKLLKLPTLEKLLKLPTLEKLLKLPTSEKSPSADEVRQALKNELRRSPIGGLLEFSRAVHAEMDALLSAARQGITPQGGRLFVTTYPCHYCARHIVASGVTEVQYIEPYPKSRALDLHGDSITHTVKGWTPPPGTGKRVLFRHFTGVAPRMFERAFQKDRELKSEADGRFQMGEPDWGSAWGVSKVSYADLEQQLDVESGESRG